MNQLFIDKLGQVATIMTRQGEAFRAKAYQKAQDTITSVSLTSTLTKENYYELLHDKPGIGPSILEKLNEICTTGTLSLIEREKNNPMNLFCDIYGVGPKKAKEIVDQGITTIAQLRSSSFPLNDNQQIGLRYYEDILLRIEREEIQQFDTLLKTIFSNLKTDFPPSTIIDYQIVGSYRRGAKDSGDIDVIITSTNSAVFQRLIDTLRKLHVILEILSHGNHKCLVVAKIIKHARRVDFLFTTPDKFPFSILYFTGSKLFNTVMRSHALSMGYTMNEHGICFKDGREVDVHFKTERNIFEFLQLQYKEPWERLDGTCVVPLSLKKEEKVNEKDVSAFVLEPHSLLVFEQYRKKGLKSLNAFQLEHIIRVLNDAYHNKGVSIVSDQEFDTIYDYYQSHFVNTETKTKIAATTTAALEVGAPVAVEKNKVNLPYLMASMDKIKPDTSSLTNWCSKYRGPYVLSCKLDGVSGLFLKEGQRLKLYTRGDGVVGQDISHLIPYLRLPEIKEDNLVIRGEFIISKSVFVSKYKEEFANPRNMVAGIINQKSVSSSKIKDVDFIPYEVIQPVLTPSAQLYHLKKIGFSCVPFLIEKSISNDSLSNLLLEWRENQRYEIDGIIVCNDQIYPRTTTLQNPEFAFAFKMILTDQIAEAQVVDVIWTPSKDGYLKPRVRILPISLGGVTIEYATGFNGAFIHDHKIGVGAIIELIRSGDVIPHIRGVKVPSLEPMMPLVPYKWNDTHVDIILENMDSNETVREKNITGFFKGIGVDGLGSGNVTRIIDAGFQSVPQIINMKVEDFLKVDGFQMTMAKKIYQGIQTKVQEASLLTIMSCSNLFGRGFSEKKIELILNAYPDVLTSTEPLNIKTKKLSQIKGFALKTAEAFVERIPDFMGFINECPLLAEKLLTNTHAHANKDGPLLDKVFVLTGFRDKALEEKLKSLGAKIGSSVTKNTNTLIVKDLTDSTQKIVDAKKYGVEIIALKDFVI